MAPSSIKITYDLKPPAGVNAGGKSTQKSHEFKVDASTDDKKAFYGALRTSLEAARNEVGDDLTGWRDIVGKAELTKEPTKISEEDEEEDVEEEEEQV